MNQLVTFFGVSDDGKTKLVGIGLTDQMIEHIKQQGGVLEPAARTKMGTDVVILYAPDMPGLIDKINRTIGEHGQVITKIL